MINAGKYKHRIKIFKKEFVESENGFQTEQDTLVLNPYAEIKTTKGITIINSNSSFEKAYTRFKIRYPKVEITRDMIIEYGGKKYAIQYLNNVDEENKELEIQAIGVNH